MDLFPAPDENNEAYKRRLEITEELFKDTEELSKMIPAPLQKSGPLHFFRSNHKLPFWTGAYTWIIETKQGIKVPIIQLPLKKRRWTLTSEEEILDHEKIHVQRAAFNEPIFEEIIAYQTSPSKWRRFLGPLFKKQSEATLFMASLILMPLIPYVPALFFALLLLRLIKRQHQFKKALHHLPPLAKESIAILSDKEIISASKNDLLFLENDNLRMKLIKKLTEDKEFNYAEEKLTTV